MEKRKADTTPPKASANAAGKRFRKSPADVAAERARLERPDFLKGGTSCSSKSTWARPPLDHIDPAKDNFAMQWIDIDMFMGFPLKTNPKKGEPVPGSSVGKVPIIRMYGVNEKGNSAVVNVHGFTPYFYCKAPPGFQEERDSGEFRERLNREVKMSARGNEKFPEHVVGVQHVKKQSILGYQSGGLESFLQIFMAAPTLVPTAKNVLMHGFEFRAGSGRRQYEVFEAAMPFTLRFMIDTDINGCNWIELPKGSYAIRAVSRTTVTVQLEIDVVYSNIVSHEPTGKWMTLAPIRVLSFDIECSGRAGHFPEAEHDPIIQIANIVQAGDKVIVRNIFELRPCLPIVGADVRSFESESKMLLEWAEFLRKCDPDIITGYNVQDFDIPYLLNRAKTLKIFDQFALWGRLRHERSRMKDSTFSSSAYGVRDSVFTYISGRVTFDVIKYMRRNHKLSSYSLNNVSSEILGQQKEDVHHSIISVLQNGSDEDRRRLAVYCLKDAHLPLQLMNKLMMLVNYVEMARVTGVSLEFLLERGQQIKVASMLYRKAKTKSLVIPTLARRGNVSASNNYEGATVIEPMKGFYDEPIATLDFASLYPSIMMAHNLCYSTLVTRENLASMPEDSYIKTPSNDAFVKSSVKKGLLPQILEELLAARAVAKRDMKKAKDPMVKAVQNGRQLALKISANSVYGFTGATVGQLPCLAISSSVTAFGRQMIDQTKAAVEERYTLANGYGADAIVVYGDTDSVMVKFGVKTVDEAMKLGLEAADEITKLFVSPVKLEFEKVYFPFLLMNKKRYAGLYWTNPHKYDKLDAKGIETVRRDNCLMVRQVVSTVLKQIIIERSVDKATAYVKRCISDLLQNKMDISMLVISKGLGKRLSECKNKMPHTELARRLEKRDPATAPRVGDRVQYVITQGAKGARAYEKSEDPVYVLENNIPIDTQYYLNNQLAKPLMRIFGPIIDNAQSLLTGAHTRVISKPTPRKKKGGIMMFAVKTAKCLGCKSVMKTSGLLCKYCKGKAGYIYAKEMAAAKQLETRFSKLWTQCQRCQGSFHQEVLCSNRDCAIFYMRKKVQYDLEAVNKKINAFRNYSW